MPQAPPQKKPAEVGAPAAWWNQGKPIEQQKPKQWGGYKPAQPQKAVPTMAPPPGLPSPPGLAHSTLRDNFSVNFALLCSSDDEEDEGAEEMLGSDGTQSVCGSLCAKSIGSNAWEASTCASMSGLRFSKAGSDKTNSPDTPATRVVSIEKALKAGAAIDVFSDNGDDEEPAMEPTPESSTPPSPQPKEVCVPDPCEELTNAKIPSASRTLQVGY